MKLMCHADLGIMTQRWADGMYQNQDPNLNTRTDGTRTGFYEPWLVYKSGDHQCKKW